MADPVPFSESNLTLVGEDCLDLPVHRGVMNGHPVVTSKWQLTKPELEEVLRTGTIWLRVWGETAPPMMLEATYPFGANSSVVTVYQTRDDYYHAHERCPKCGTDQVAVTTFAGDIFTPNEPYKDVNEAACPHCGWEGVVDALAPRPKDPDDDGG